MAQPLVHKSNTSHRVCERSYWAISSTSTEWLSHFSKCDDKSVTTVPHFTSISTEIFRTLWKTISIPLRQHSEKIISPIIPRPPVWQITQSSWRLCRKISWLYLTPGFKIILYLILAFILRFITGFKKNWIVQFFSRSCSPIFCPFPNLKKKYEKSFIRHTIWNIIDYTFKVLQRNWCFQTMK